MYKNLFSMSDGIYLLSHSVGRMPASTKEFATKAFFTPWEHDQLDPWSSWMGVFDEFTNTLAELFNTNAEQFCPQQNLSSGLSKIVGSLPEAGLRNTILVSEHDFPSMAYALQQATKKGYRIKYISAESDHLAVDVWKKELDSSVFCCFITHVQSNTGVMAPVESIILQCRDKGIMSIVDIAQSAGIEPIDLNKWNADFVLGSCVKWLCGGPGAGFLWVNHNLLDSFNPVDVGWFSHQNPFEFDIHKFEYAEDARRFWGGTPSVLPYAIATNSIRQILDIGVSTIREHNNNLIQCLIDTVDRDWVVSPVEHLHRGGTLILKVANQTGLSERLQTSIVAFDERPFGIRLSPHIYTSKEEIDIVVNCLSQGAR